MQKFHIGFTSEDLFVIVNPDTPEEKRFADSIDGLHEAAGLFQNVLKHLFPDAEVEVEECC